MAPSAAGSTDRPLARLLAASFNPYHNVVYYSPEINVFVDAGLRGWWQSYFAYRAAPFGRVPAEVVAASFYNFALRMVERAVPAAWDVVPPEQALALRLTAVDGALRRILGADGVVAPELASAAALAREAVEGSFVGARPLFAAHAALPWPDEPHLALWHACTLLREQRGDAHALALAAAEVDGAESHVLMVASGHGNRASILPIRGWTEDEWDAATGRLVERGWLTPDGAFTAAGRAGRAAIEAHTDVLAGEPVERLGADGLERLAALMAPAVALVRERGGVPASWPPPHLLR
jgi:hypothetical protein